MTMERHFHIGDLLSLTAGRLVSPRHMDGVYDLIDFVTGVPHFTHQLPRAAREVAPWLLRQHPWLEQVQVDFNVPADASKEEAAALVAVWLARVADEHGAEHVVRTMPEGMYLGREPLAELQEMAGGKPIIVIHREDAK